MSHTWMSHVTHANESCHTYEWVMPHAILHEPCHILCIGELSHVTHMNEPCYTDEWVMPQAIFNKPCHTYQRAMSHIWMSHVIQIWKQSLEGRKHILRIGELSHVSHMNEPCHTYERVMSHVRMSHVIQILKEGLKHILCIGALSMLCIGALSHVTHMNESCHTYEWVTSHMWTSHVIRMNESWHTDLRRGSEAYFVHRRI